MKGRPKHILARMFGTTSVGAQLMMRRMAQGLSLEQLAAKAGIDRQYLESLEEGAVHPRASVVRKLAKALGVTVAELVK